MKLQDIIILLRKRLPFYTDLFTELLGVDSLIYDTNSSLLTLNTTVNHGLSSNDLVSLANIIEPIGITSLNYQSQQCTAIATCEFPHDIVINKTGYGGRFKPGANLYQPCIYSNDTIITISGADQTEYNGQHVVIEVIDANTFEYLIIGDQPTITPATGTIILEKALNLFNGIFPITATSPNQFTLEIVPNGVDLPIPPVAPLLSSIQLKVRHRISGAATVERAIQSYTRQSTNDLWLFCVREGTSQESSIASQQRTDPTDGVGTVTDGSIFRQNILQKLSIIVFFPTTNSISAREQRDLVEDIRTYIFKSVLGIKLPSQLSSKSQIGLVYVSDDPISYNSAFYIHRFTFENTVTLTNDDIAPVLSPISINALELTYLNADKIKDEIIMTDKISYEES